MGRAGRAFVHQNYNIATLNRRLARIYEMLAENEPVLEMERTDPMAQSGVLRESRNLAAGTP